MMNQEKIEIAITSESINNLKRAISVLKDAYRTSAARQSASSENAVLTFMLPAANDLIADIEASYSALNSYEKATLDEIKKPTQMDLSSFKDLDNLEGNYPISPELLKNVRSEVNTLLGRSGSGGIATKNALQSGKAFSENSKQSLSATQDPEPENISQNLSASESSQSNTYKGKDKGGILKNCIPCSTRTWHQDSKGWKPGSELLGVLENDLVTRYKRLINQMESMFTNTDVYDDICNLANHLDTNCVPDLRAIIALLTALSAKLVDIKLLSPTNMFLGLITPFFAPMLNGLTELLDKYVQLIIAPVNCLINEMDKQLAKLDVSRSISAFDAARSSELNNKYNFLQRKRVQLIDRKNLLLSGGYGGYINPETIRSFGTNAAEKLERQEDWKTKRELEGIEEELLKLDGNMGNNGQLKKIKDEIDAISNKTSTSATVRNEVGPIRSAAGAVSGARDGIKEVRNGIGSGLRSLRGYTIQGRNFINESLAAWQKELQRLLFGRAASTEEMMQGMADLQKIARLIAIANALTMFYEQTRTGKGLCSGKDPSKSMGYLYTNAISGAGGDLDSGAPLVFSGTDESGEAILLVASPGSVVELIGQNETERLENLSKDNASGITPDIGSIANKIVTSTDEFGRQAPVAIAKFNLCGKPDASTAESLDKIKSWASNLG